MTDKKTPLGYGLRGFLMGCADVVPGVSGGTVAFVTGIYSDLLLAVKSAFQTLPLLLRGRFRDAFARVDFLILVPLFSGIILAFLSMAKLIRYCMEHHAEMTWGLFLGLMVASVLIVVRMIGEWKFDRFTMIALSAVLAYKLTSLGYTVTPEGHLYFFAAGAIAITAMILPGVSGSFLLLMLGKYEQVLGALDALTSGELAAFANVAVPFGLGCLTGLALFPHVLLFFMKKMPDLTYAFLIGLMSGSLHRLWPFRQVIEVEVVGDKRIPLREHVGLPTVWDSVTYGAIAMIVLGFVIVTAMDIYARRQSKETANQ